jgi:hypothetical protein
VPCIGRIAGVAAVLGAPALLINLPISESAK